MATGIRWIDRYWGKARPRSDDGPCWHPLAWHSLDVSAAMEAMLDIRPAWLTAVADCAGLTRDEARKRLILVAALHDLGKFADNFQRKVPDLHRALQPDACDRESRSGHGDVAAVMWNTCQAEVELHVLDGWAMAAFAHHGAPVAETGLADAASPAAIDDATAFARSAVALIGAPDGQYARGGAWLVAGLVILADWIGSNQEWFAYAHPEATPADYWAQAKDRARRAVTEAHLAEAGATARFDLAMLIGTAAVPSPLQAWAAAQEPQRGRHLYVIEDLTGAGKTEAALILAHRLMQDGVAEGLYWALPTMATANGLYRRLAGTYRALFAVDADPSLVLSHGAADIDDGFQASIGRERDETYGESADPQDIGAAAFCAAFAAEERKKNFLAQVGVGTLDQVLLGVLPVRHQSLRLAALARRVLIVDEAHSYDPYTSRTMERLLEFHAAHGGSAIVLSATLTQALRRNLIKTYSREAAKQLEKADFPLVSHVAGDTLTETPLGASRGTRRDLLFRRFDTPDDAMAALLERAQAGYCTVYICNTVADAIAAYEHLRALAPEGVHVDLFHARYAAGDRWARETEVLKRFGKKSTPKERHGQLLVATQVIESSLDLDFDYLCSDLCPVPSRPGIPPTGALKPCSAGCRKSRGPAAYAVPSRYLKSICTAVTFAAWQLGHHPAPRRGAVSGARIAKDAGKAHSCRLALYPAGLRYP
jgi:CRISPR-associated endonuclease/helicase Cas3